METEGQAIEVGGRDLLLRRVIEYGLLALIVLSPLPAASVYEWSILGIQLVALVMLAAFVLLEHRPAANPALLADLKWPSRLLKIFAAFVVVQAVPWPGFIVSMLSPGAAAFRSDFHPLFAGGGLASFSLVPARTVQAGLELLPYVIVGFLVVRTVTHRHQIRRILVVLVAMGFFEAFYGLFELSRSNPRVLFYKKIYNLDSLTGTFINRNHLSGYLEMILPLAIGLVLARVDFFAVAGKGWRDKILQFAGKGATQNVLTTLAGVVIAIGIVLSRSRSGAFALVFGFILFIGLTALYFGRLRARQAWMRNFLTFMFWIVVLFSLYVGVGATIQRFGDDNLLTGGRPVYWKNVLGIVGRFPLVGTGLGTFGYVYPAFEEAQSVSEGVLLHAHNDYLELLSELGFAGMLLFAGAVFLLILKGFMMWRTRVNPEMKGLALGGFVSVFLILFHSLTDFNLQIPANRLLFVVVLALTLVMSYHGRTPGRTAQMRRFQR
jgi:O-antigen ligase